MNNNKEARRALDLQEMVARGIIDLAFVEEQVEAMNRSRILQGYESSIWYSESEQSWCCYVPDETKKTKRKKVKRRNKSDLEDYLYDFETGKITDKPKWMTLRLMREEFFNYKKTLVCGSTVKKMTNDWKRFYEPHPEFIDKPLMELKGTDVDIFFNTIVDDFHLQERTFRNASGILKQMLEYAEDAGYVFKSVYRSRVIKKKFARTKKTAKTEVYKDDERENIIKEMERRFKNNPTNLAPLAIMLDFELGLRKGEMLAISMDDIEDDRIHIHRQLTKDWDVTDVSDIKFRGWKVVEYTKSECGDRYIPLTDRAKDIIDRAFEISNLHHDNKERFIFWKDGKNLEPQCLTSSLNYGNAVAGIEHKPMHKIRKTYASTLLHSGVNVSAVKDMLGHSSETTTMKYYIFDTEEEKQRDKDVIAALKKANERAGIGNCVTV